jgi:hypothetical protein
MHVKYMAAFAPNERAAITWYGTCWATGIVGHLTYTTNIFILHVPRPVSRYGPCVHFDLHSNGMHKLVENATLPSHAIPIARSLKKIFGLEGGGLPPHQCMGMCLIGPVDWDLGPCLNRVQKMMKKKGDVMLFNVKVHIMVLIKLYEKYMMKACLRNSVYLTL